MKPTRPFEEIGGPVAKPLRLFLAAFAMGLCGVVFAFVIDYGPNRPLTYLALGIVALAVAIGFFAIVWGYISIVRYHHPRRR